MKCHIVIIASDRALTIGDGKNRNERTRVNVHLFLYTVSHTGTGIPLLQTKFCWKQRNFDFCTADKCTASHIQNFIPMTIMVM